MTSPRELELLGRAREGDHEAFAILMREQEDRVFSVCLRIMGDRETALDAAQETFLTVFRKSSQFRGESAFGTWVYRIAVNSCYDLLRKQKRRRTEPLPEHHDPIDHGAEEAVESAGLRPEIAAALQEVPDEFRAVIVLSDIEGLGMADIAEILDIPTGTVKSRLFRGRRILAQRLGNQTPS